MARDTAQAYDNFNPATEERMPDNTRASQGILPDRSIAEAIDGVSGLFDKTIKGVNQWFEQTTTDILTKETDLVKDEFGVGSMETKERQITGNQPTPVELQKAGEHLGTLTQAYRAGTLSGSNYWARMESVARQVRARYPGHREHIDREIQRLTGAVPANRLVQELEQDARQSESRVDKRQALLTTMSGEEIDMRQPLRDESSGKPWSMDQLRLYRNSQLSMKFARDKAKDEHSIAASQNRLDKTKVAEAATSDLNNAFATEFKTLSGGIAPTHQEFVRKTQAMIENPSAENQEALIKIGAQYKMMLEEAKRRTLYVNKPKDGKTWQELVDPDDFAKIEAQADKYINSQLASLGKDPKIGTLQMTSAIAEGLQDDAKKDLLKEKVMRYMGAAREIAGPDAANMYLSDERNTDVFQGFDQAMRKGIGMAAVTNANPKLTSGSKVLDELKDGGVTDPKVYKATIDDMIKTVVDPKMPMSMRLTAAKKLYSENNSMFMSKIPVGDVPAYYTSMVNGKVADAIWIMSGNGQDPVWNDYKEWAERSAQAVFKPVLNDLNNMAGSEHVKVEYNPETYTFKPVGTGGSPDQPAQVPPIYKKQVDNLNKAIQTLVPLWRKEGKDPNEAAAEIFVALGINKMALKGNAEQLMREFVTKGGPQFRNIEGKNQSRLDNTIDNIPGVRVAR